MADHDDDDNTILSWYAGIGAKYLNLVGDFAGKERFFIEGDSLLLECFNNPQLDFDRGFQILHAVYLVEQVLQNLHKRGCYFDLVFFDNHRSHCVPVGSLHSSRYFLARTLIIEHISTHAVNSIQILKFRGLSDSRFVQYLHDSACYFALCSDGARYTYSKQSSSQLKTHASSLDAFWKSGDNKVKLRKVIYNLQAKTRLDVALLNGLTWQDSKVFAFVLERITTGLPTLLDHEWEADAYSRGRTPTPPPSPTPPSSEIWLRPREPRSASVIIKQAYTATKSIMRSQGLCPSFRLVATVAAVEYGGHQEPSFIYALFIHTMILEVASLSSRRLSAIHFSLLFEKQYHTFVDNFCLSCDELFRRGISQKAKVDATLADIFDGRLLRHVLSNPMAALDQLPEHHKNIVQCLTAFLTGDNFRWLKEDEQQGEEQNEKIPQPTTTTETNIDESDTSSILSFSHPAFDKHLLCVRVNLDGVKEPFLGKFAVELTHWHNSKKPLGARNSIAKDARQEAKRLRAHQKLVARMTAYSASLTNAQGKSLNPELILVEKSSSARKGGSRATKKFTTAKGAAKLATTKENSVDKNTNTANESIGDPSSQQKLERERADVDPETDDDADSVSSEDSVRTITESTSTALVSKLENDGPTFERSMNARDDPRVPFKPDGWQIQVLDELDAGSSLLVVAPTSSGKTFISFYAMEKVLRANDDDVIVYVAPKKALVNQIAAEVQARFRKNYRPGRTMYAIHTRDYRMYNPTKCQILVTVPHILQIMLMSPANKEWVPKIKSIIFDEIHSISQTDDGLVWEQLLISSPCQIIALSATVGNAESFSGWLSAAQSSVGRTLTLVHHGLRYSDLRQYMYSPPTSCDLASGLPKKSPNAPLGLEKVISMKHIHPIVCLLQPRRGMPDDLALESRDCLALWSSMKKHSSHDYPVASGLSPSNVFLSETIVKGEVVEWGRMLKAQFADWIKAEDSPFQKVMDELTKNLELPDDTLEEGFSVPSGKIDSKNLLDTTMPLLCDLRTNNALPAIVFNYNRAACQDIAERLCSQLVEAEEAYKKHSSAWQAKMARYTLWQKNTKTQERKTVKGKADKKSGVGAGDDLGSKQDRARAEVESRDSSFDTFTPDAPLDDFSFANPKKGDQQLLKEALSSFEYAGISAELIKAFCRGIGVHHSGMNRWYRQAVEMFFRRGFLTVVIATGTLSLGINMPCKTVVFSGDSVFLTALNFRQASGRAGRRGFDLLGNVIFQNISTERALRLLSSKLPDINGHFPLTTSFVLRLLTLLSGTSNAQYAMNMVNALLSQPRLYLGGEGFKHQVLHHVRFSIEYLRSQGLIDAQGRPLNFASCVSHLYFVENSAFAFHTLLKDGYFRDLANEFVNNEEATLRKLMLVMAHLFGRKTMRSVESESEKELIKQSASVVFLPELPREASDILQQHNRETLATYRTYVATFVEQHCQERDSRLPFTKISVASNTEEGDDVLSLISSPPTALRSPFVALSGHGDDFESVSDLCSTVRDGVFLEKAVIPHLDMGQELPNPLNAYLYDFFVHGTVQALIKANRIPRGDVWFVLKDFALVLATIVTSFENFLDPDSSGEVQAVGSGDEDEPGDGELDQSATIATPPPANMCAGKSAESKNTAVHRKKTANKKLEVLDSWEDEDLEDELEELYRENSTGQAGADTEAKTETAGEIESAGRVEKEMKSVYRMFEKLEEEFNVRFRQMWA